MNNGTMTQKNRRDRWDAQTSGLQAELQMMAERRAKRLEADMQQLAEMRSKDLNMWIGYALQLRAKTNRTSAEELSLSVTLHRLQEKGIAFE